MKKTKLILLVLLLGGIGMAGNAGASLSGMEELVIRNVNIIPMDCERVIANQTVMISQGRIRSIADNELTEIPSDVKIIDGSGKYLLPGLIDMHTHVCDPNDLPLFIAHGVTAIRNMSDLPGWVKFSFGFADIRDLRRKVNDGAILGPDIYTAGCILDGKPPVSPFNQVVIGVKDAEEAVIRQKKQGYDFIKVYDGLSVEAYHSILAAARKYELPVIGHIPKKVGIDGALESGLASIEHLTGYIDNDQGDFVIPEDKIGEYAEKTCESGIWNCPTLVIWDHLAPRKDLERIEKLPEMKYVSWRVEWLWNQTLKAVYRTEYQGTDYPGHMMEISQKMTSALYKAHAKLILGTDTNFVGVFPGWATQRELELLVDVGLTPYEAIKTGTYNAAECLNKLDEFGTITAGKRADLLLIDENPLMDVKNIKKISGVILRGQWLPINEIQKKIKKQ